MFVGGKWLKYPYVLLTLVLFHMTQCVPSPILPTRQLLPLPSSSSSSSTSSSDMTGMSVWPPRMKNYDIWGSNGQPHKLVYSSPRPYQQLDNTVVVPDYHNKTTVDNAGRNGKVLNFFPVPVDDECISDDGRRSGICLNVYECRIQGGTAKGQCALGFGVCCIFTATCEQEVFNNITYIVSPNFPAIMSTEMKTCKIKIKMISTDVSQLRLDFVHFSLGQPNRSTGICDGDTFTLTGGSGGNFTLCGQNHGQHIYYDVPSQIAREEQPTDLSLLMDFTDRFATSRLWEIRVYQIPFSQRAPAGCLQYFTGTEGVIKTFNFAENGRHLANQNYRSCVRQESGMCSISYEPCHDRSFRIGQNPNGFGGVPAFGGGGGGGAGAGGAAVPGAADPIVGQESVVPAETLADPNAPLNNEVLNPGEELLADPAASPAPADGTADEPAPAADDSVAEETQEDPTNSEDPNSDDPEAVEGSGDDGGGGFFDSISSLFSRGIPPYLREGRQFSTTCTDRITTPCVVEDFIAAGMGTVPDCRPIHCGNSLCANGIDTGCRIESTVAPFGIGVHFGEGADKGSPEDNIGACLKFSQTACV